MKKNLSLRSPAPVTACVCSAALTVLSLSAPYCSLLAWIALVPYLRALHRQPLPRRLAYSALFGGVFFAGLIYWLSYVSFLGLSVLVMYLTIYPLIFGWLVPRIDRFRDLIWVPLVWTALELIRSYALTGFGWGLIGYSQAENILIVQIVDRVGIWGLSALVVAVNTAIAQVLTPAIPRFQRRTAVLAAGTAAAVSVAYGAWCLGQTYPAPTITISVIQPNIPQERKWDPDHISEILAQLQRLTLQAAVQQPDVIVWPETSVPGYVLDELFLARWISRLARQAATFLIIGSQRSDYHTENYYNSAMLFDPAGKLVSYYDKIRLVPFGEYIPFGQPLIPFQAIPIGDFSAGSEFTLLPVVTAAGETVYCAVFICFEDIFPYLAKRFQLAGADVFIHITNEAWFGRSTQAFQHVAKSIVRAVENRRWFIRSANTGISCVIDSHGRIQSRVEHQGQLLMVEGVITAAIEAPPRRQE